jgi:hypothetical protein
MALASVPDEDFISLFEQHGPAETARRLGLSDTRQVYNRRARLEGKIGRQITAPEKTNRATRVGIEHPGRLDYQLLNGTAIVSSDAHYWKGIVPVAHRALLHFIKELKPKAVIKNGDAFDGARASRHPPINWEERPTIIDELEGCQERMNEIQKAAKTADLFWPLGNHDSRFETRLATAVPDFARVKGFHLKDHFSERWKPCLSVFINDNVVVKHRFKGGIHATHNNTLWGGKTIVTGHLHSLKVTPFTDYNGTRWGVDTGCIADTYGPQFMYVEDNPLNWRSGFAVLTFVDGRLLWPEVVHVIGPDEVEFRGKVIRV